MNAMETVTEGEAKRFVDSYYNTFDANRAALADLYQLNSMLSFEGQKIQGTSNIVAKLSTLPPCRHSLTNVDFQPAGDTGGMLVFVTGDLQFAEEQHDFKFNQMFHLVRTNFGNVIVLNDFFRLIDIVSSPEMQVIPPVLFTGAQLLDISN